MKPFHVLLFIASSIPANATAPAYRDALIPGVPHVLQKPDFCGEACAEMALRKLGKDLDQDYVFDRSGLDPLQGRGCFTAELKEALEKIGFRVGPVFHEVKAAEAPEALERLWGALHADLLKGIPSIVCCHYAERPGATEHFRLILGYDPAADEVIYHEPAEAGGAYRRMERSLFLRLWPLKYKERTWTVIRLRLEPGKIEAGPAPPGLTSADYAQHVMALKKKVPPGFSMVLEPPFLVLGDEPLPEVRSRSTHTVRWAVDMLKQDFFPKDPEEILDIWLFKDEASYRKHAKKVFGDEPSTPFGYYSEAHRALIMNISTGGGTLVHEIVHPFMKANFPRSPAWFNEGLASLYEQSAERDGHIQGLTNWRLEGLQRAIRAGETVPFEKLTSTTDSQFYSEARGVHYAQARYLLYYLQEKGSLLKFYREFTANRKDDPTGIKCLKKVLGEDDLKAFRKSWESYILKLTFP